MGDIIKEFISLMSFSHVIVVKLSVVAEMKSHHWLQLNES